MQNIPCFKPNLAINFLKYYRTHCDGGFCFISSIASVAFDKVLQAKITLAPSKLKQSYLLIFCLTFIFG